MADLIDKLPTDDTPIESIDIKILDNVFKPENINTINNVVLNTKDIFIAGFLFILVSLPLFNSIINKTIPSTRNSEYITIIVKSAAFMILLFFVNNFYLSRTK